MKMHDGEHGPFIDFFFGFIFRKRKNLFSKKRLQFESFLGLHDPLDDPFGQGFTPE